MEIADQWQREWAGTAEYGKVTEGGVTRRIARAMEVLHASGPGSRVRVMRAAYHSTAGPGTPAASFMLHSSRRVISSGFNFLESPTSPTKPLEISSTPLESSPELEIENYKVTEPDDFEISEPSKWRAATGGSTIRMPSEESSSTDNASIIDLDSRHNHKGIHRKYSCDSENSDVNWNQRNSRVSPLLDAPVTLSTLKYKSLLNGSNDWNNRRKSYSFEDTSPLNDTITHTNDTLAMESSTDSGICKSSEIVNDHIDENTSFKYSDRKERLNSEDDSFKNWLSKNRPNSFYKGTKYKTYREHKIVVEDPIENNITLQSTGKVSITLPVTVETDDNVQVKNNTNNEDNHRKVKKVEFCKTEVHFAAESGKVNIIATDDKPPPSNDFRKRRNFFVPMHEFEKPITLFGEKVHDFNIIDRNDDLLKPNYSELNDTDENTAATKSILKNKIPKPKPYLLGENMAFGSQEDVNNLANEITVPTAVSIINKQLHADKLQDEGTNANFHKKVISSINYNAFRTTSKGPEKIENLRQEIYGTKVQNNEGAEVKSVKYKTSSERMSPTSSGLKTRQLRESDLTYFGIDNGRHTNKDKTRESIESISSLDRNSVEDLFHSVKLIQQVSNSVCNSESEDGPEYQNIPINTNFTPVPTPRMRSKLDDKLISRDSRTLMPIIEGESKVTNDISITRRTKMRRQEEANVHTSRSLSEPRKSYMIDKTQRLLDKSRCNKYRESTENDKLLVRKSTTHMSDDDSPIYVNLKNKEEIIDLQRNSKFRRSLREESPKKTNNNKTDSIKLSHNRSTIGNGSLRKDNNDKGSMHKKDQNNIKKSYNAQETPIKSSTVAEKVRNMEKDIHKLQDKTKIADRIPNGENGSNKKRHEHKSRTLERQNHKVASYERHRDIKNTKSKDRNEIYSKQNDEKYINKRASSKDGTISGKNSPQALQKIDPNVAGTRHKNADIKNNEKNMTNNVDLKMSSHRKSKPSKYVINYDDKNGTMSSICMIKPGLGAPRKKHISKELYKESPKENIIKHKTVKLPLRK